MRDFTGTVVKLVDLTPTAKGVFIELDGDGMNFQAGITSTCICPTSPSHAPFTGQFTVAPHV